MTATNTGKSSEDLFEAYFHEQGYFVHRFQDYADINAGRQRAKRVVGSQPSDYHLTKGLFGEYAEVKSISKGKSFPFSRIERKQWITATKVNAIHGQYFFYLHFMESGVWYRVPASFVLESEKKSANESELQRFSYDPLTTISTVLR